MPCPIWWTMQLNSTQGTHFNLKYEDNVILLSINVQAVQPSLNSLVIEISMYGRSLAFAKHMHALTCHGD